MKPDPQNLRAFVSDSGKDLFRLHKTLKTHISEYVLMAGDDRMKAMRDILRLCEFIVSEYVIRYYVSEFPGMDEDFDKLLDGIKADLKQFYDAMNGRRTANLPKPEQSMEDQVFQVENRDEAKETK